MQKYILHRKKCLVCVRYTMSEIPRIWIYVLGISGFRWVCNDNSEIPPSYLRNMSASVSKYFDFFRYNKYGVHYWFYFLRGDHSQASR